MQVREHLRHCRPVGGAAEVEALHLDERHAVAIGLRHTHAGRAQGAQSFEFRREHAGTIGRAGLGERQTPDSLRLAIDRRSTRISMNARSNLCRQLSEAWARWSVGTEMMLPSAATVTSAPRRVAFFER